MFIKNPQYKNYTEDFISVENQQSTDVITLFCNSVKV